MQAIKEIKTVNWLEMFCTLNYSIINLTLYAYKCYEYFDVSYCNFVTCLMESIILSCLELTNKSLSGSNFKR